MPQYGKLKIDQFLYNDSGTDVTLNLADLVTTGANTFTGNQSLGDNLKVQLGTGNEFQIYHDSAGHTYLTNSAGNFHIQNPVGENSIRVIPNGSVELYYDNVKKFETTSYGTLLTGNSKWVDNGKATFGDSDDLQLFHDGSNSYIKEAGTGNVIHEVTDATIEFKKGGSEHLAKFIPDGAVELYYDNVKKLETISVGAQVLGEFVTNQNAYSRVTHQENGASKWSCGLRANGDDDYHLYREGGSGNVVIDNGNLNLGDSQNIHIGNSNDLILRHDGSNAYIACAQGTIHIMGKSGENSIQAQPDGAVELYYDNSKKIETTSSGVKFWGTTNHLSWIQVSNDDKLRFNDGVKATFGNSDDLRIYHDGSNRIRSVNSTCFIEGDPGYYIGIRPQIGENSAKFLPNGAVELYYDDSKKLETTSTGINVTGAITVNGAALAGGSSYAGLLKYF